MRRYLPALVLALPLIFGPTPLNAWDTGLNEKAPWKGIYKHGGRAPRDGPGLSQFTTGKNRNEHTEMANATLHKMGAATAFAMESMEPLSITDLNASLLRRDLKASGSRIGLEDRGTFEDNPATALEERSFPAPPHFAGIPDFSYTIYDWVSKNVLCPPLPVGAPYRRRCHSYAHWHGAALNASHFGTQAGDMYVHIHRVALNLAGRARDMRQRLERSDAPGDLTAHRDFVREAELMALAYEGYAQHFLQDRWSMGHMWERWNAGGYDHVAYPQSLGANLEVGVIAGLLHGAQAVVNFPDAMSSPSIIPRHTGGGNMLNAVTWRHGRDGAIHPGVGDLRLLDMFDGGYGKEYIGIDLALGVDQQKREMLVCFAAGWAEVIRAFGKADAGGFGIHGVGLASGVPTGPPGPDCFDMWATNEAVAEGWNGGLATIAGGLGRLVKASEFDPSYIVDVIRMDIKIAWRSWLDPNGTDLARRNLGNLGKAEQGGEYRKKVGGPYVPKYVVPVNLDSLPERDDIHGRDKNALYGFFNRAHADYWCEGGPEGDIKSLLAKYRASKDKTEAEACWYLADRVYKGTDPRYDGAQKEIRTVDGKKGSPAANPICWHYGVAPQDYDEKLPVHLHPGYVGFVEGHKPYDRTVPLTRSIAAQSIANWCDETPVLDYMDDKRNEDIVARSEDPEKEIKLAGLNLGSGSGTLEIWNDSLAATPVSVTAWTDTSISFKLPKEPKLDDSEYFLSVTTSGGKKSRGRFVLEMKDKIAHLARVQFTPGMQTSPHYDYQWRPASTPNFRGRKKIADQPIDPGYKDKGELRLTFSAPIDPAQLSVFLGDKKFSVTPGPENKVFTGLISGEALESQAKDGKVAIEVQARDKNGEPIDGKAQTVARPDPDKPGEWKGYDKVNDTHHALSVGADKGFYVASLFTLNQALATVGGIKRYVVSGRSHMEWKAGGSWDGGAEQAILSAPGESPRAVALDIALGITPDPQRDSGMLRGDAGFFDFSQDPEKEGSVEVHVAVYRYTLTPEQIARVDHTKAVPALLQSAHELVPGPGNSWTPTGLPFDVAVGLNFCLEYRGCDVALAAGRGEYLLHAWISDADDCREKPGVAFGPAQQILTRIVGKVASNIPNIRFEEKADPSDIPGFLPTVMATSRCVSHTDGEALSVRPRAPQQVQPPAPAQPRSRFGTRQSPRKTGRFQ